MAYTLKKKDGTVMGVVPVALDSAASQSSDTTQSAPQTAWFLARIAALEAMLLEYEVALSGYQTVLTNATDRITLLEQEVFPQNGNN